MVKNPKNLILIAIVVAGLLIVGVVIFVNQEKVEEITPVEPKVEPKAEPSLVNFAKCLSEKEIKFYGTYWCGACQRQKELFGVAAVYLPYIECDQDQATKDELRQCQEAGVGPIPDWRFPDGHQELGMLSLEKLAELSGCPL